MLCKMIGSLVSKDAASKGSAAFLFPAGVTSPFNGTPPSIMNLSMNISLEIEFWDTPCKGFSPGSFGVNPAFARFYPFILFSRGLPLVACAIVRQFTGFGKHNTQYFTKSELKGYPKTGVSAYAETPVFGLLLFRDLMILTVGLHRVTGDWRL